VASLAGASFLDRLLGSLRLVLRSQRPAVRSWRAFAVSLAQISLQRRLLRPALAVALAPKACQQTPRFRAQPHDLIGRDIGITANDAGLQLLALADQRRRRADHGKLADAWIAVLGNKVRDQVAIPARGRAAPVYLAQEPPVRDSRPRRGSRDRPQ